MSNKTSVATNFRMGSFSYENVEYNVVLVEELYNNVDDDNPDFTGNYLGILISNRYGTVPFLLLADTEEDGKWEMEFLTTERAEINAHWKLPFQPVINSAGNMEDLSIPSGKPPFEGIIDNVKEIMQKGINGLYQ